MILANRSSLNNTRSLLRAFGGLNETYGCTEAEYSTGLNFSARDFPALSTRMPRRKLQELTGLNGMYHLNGLLTVCGRDLVYTPDEDPDRPVRVKNAVADSRKTLVGIGTRVLIFPDKIAFDTADGTAASLGALWEAGEISVTFAPCDAEGKTYEGTAKGTQEPEEPADGQRFLKIADPEKPYAAGSTLEEYSEASGSWTPIPLEYCLVTAEGIGTDFRVWDTVTLTGTGAEEAGQWEELDGDRIVYDAAENRLRLRADPGGGKFYGKLIRNGSSAVWVSLDEEERQEMVLTEAVRVERRVPDLEFLTECDNRVWGCSSRENVIYACKLGDPTNWFSYRGIAADSYAVTVGSDGPFTGAATCMGYALFFKENTLHKLYGSRPSDFQLSSLRCRGVARNAARSLCVLNETLYYLSPDGVMAWDGSIPAKVSAALDAGRLSNVKAAVGGALDGRYYLHIAREDRVRLLVYDTERGLWHEEDVCSCEMASTGGQLYLWDGSALWAADPGREAAGQSSTGTEQEVPFELVTGDLGMDSPEERYLTRLTLRLDAACRSRLVVEMSYDGGPWEEAAARTLEGPRRCLDLPLVPRRCGSLRLRLRGSGQITLRSLAKSFGTVRGGRMEQEG
nr:MAG TPA: stabilization protein [Caudoviricetes sp.]